MTILLYLYLSLQRAATQPNTSETDNFGIPEKAFILSFHFVSNTGPITISPAESIFNLGVTSKPGGTGIGMYLCKEICEEFGWSINVSSQGNLVDFKIEFGDEK